MGWISVNKEQSKHAIIAKVLQSLLWWGRLAMGEGAPRGAAKLGESLICIIRAAKFTPI